MLWVTTVILKQHRGNEKSFYFFVSGRVSSVARLLSLSRNRAIRQSRKPTPDRAKTARRVPWIISLNFSLPTPFNANANAATVARLRRTLRAANKTRRFPGPVLLPGLSTLNTTRQNNHENVAPTKNAIPLPAESSHLKSGVTCFTENNNTAINPRLKALENRMTRSRSRSSRPTDFASSFTLQFQSAL